MKIKDLIYKLDDFCPFSLQDDFDNSGLQFGNLESDCSKAFFALDLTYEIIQKAIETNCDVIITHHPFFFSGIKSLDPLSFKGQIINELFLNKISVISLHTNWDKHPKGVSFALGEIIGLKHSKILFPEGEYGYGFFGDIDEKSFGELIIFLEKSIGISKLRYFYGSMDKKVNNVGILGGSGGSFIADASKKDIDVFITGDLDYHDGQKARELNLPIIDIGHFNSEKFGLKYLREFVAQFMETEEYIIPITEFSY